jgi:hypothetical protein
MAEVHGGTKLLISCLGTKEKRTVAEVPRSFSSICLYWPEDLPLGPPLPPSTTTHQCYSGEHTGIWGIFPIQTILLLSRVQIDSDIF